MSKTKATTEMDALDRSTREKTVYEISLVPVCLWDNVQTETSKRKMC